MLMLYYKLVYLNAKCCAVFQLLYSATVQDLAHLDVSLPTANTSPYLSKCVELRWSRNLQKKMQKKFLEPVFGLLILGSCRDTVVQHGCFCGRGLSPLLI